MSLVEVRAIFLVIAVAIATFAGDTRLPWLRSAARLLSGSTGLSLPNGRFVSYVETIDGRLLHGDTIIWGWEPDALIVDQDSNAEPTLVPFRELKAISAKGLRPIRVALTAAVLVSAGTFVGGYLAANSSQLELRDGRFLGFLAGAFLSPVVVWLLQDTPWLTRYRVVYPKAEA